MENYIIYQDQNTKIEIDGLFHSLLSEMQAPYFNLEPAFIQALISKIAQLIDKKGLATLDKIVVCSTKVYLIGNNCSIILDKPFAEFNKGIDIIAQTDNFRLNKEKITQQITKLYNSDNFIFEIYDYPHYGVDGYFCDIREDNIYVMFFSYIDF